LAWARLRQYRDDHGGAGERIHVNGGTHLRSDNDAFEPNQPGDVLAGGVYGAWRFGDGCADDRHNVDHHHRELRDHGDRRLGSDTGTTVVNVTVNGSYTVTATSPASIAPGASATSTVTIASTNGYAGSVTLTCALTSSPSGATDLPSCTNGSRL